MKIKILFFATITLFIMSCRHDIVFKDVIIPADTEVTFLESTGKEINGFLIVLGDTTGDGITDIQIKVPYRPMIERICFLRVAYPHQNIRIEGGSISKHNNDFVFNAGNANVVKVLK